MTKPLEQPPVSAPLAMTKDSQAVPHRHGWLIVNLVAFGLLAMAISLPSMQEWPAIFGASQARVQLTFSGFVAAYGGLQLVYGPLSDRLGRKPVLLAGLVLTCLASLMAAVAPDLGTLTAARVLQGAGSAAGMVIGRALIQDLYAGRERTRMMAFVGMTMGLCPPLGTLIGGQIHVRLGWQSNFLLLALVALALLLASWRGLPERTPDPGANTRGWGELLSGYSRLARMPAFALYVVILSMATATFYTFLSGAPVVLAGYGITPERIGWYITCPPIAYIFGNILTTRLIRRMGDRSIMMWGQGFTVGGVALVLLLGVAGPQSALSLALPMMFFGLGQGLLVPPALAGTVGLVPALAGSAAAVAGVMQQFTGALGGFVVGLVPHKGSVNLALLMLAWAVCGLAVQVVLHQRLLRRGGGAESG
jgi:MFS transporter, DHA1 family, multidrug resistance protein